jgi:hypothetical protein
MRNHVRSGSRMSAKIVPAVAVVALGQSAVGRDVIYTRVGRHGVPRFIKVHVSSRPPRTFRAAGDERTA